jgi:hypothetical protein
MFTMLTMKPFDVLRVHRVIVIAGGVVAYD